MGLHDDKLRKVLSYAGHFLVECDDVMPGSLLRCPDCITSSVRSRIRESTQVEMVVGRVSLRETIACMSAWHP